MHSPKVSVIIPVYNTAPYLHEALSSITGQTLQELEIIIVNDGSTDGSGEIIREVTETDGRIKVFEQENQGQSVARNVGLEQATGEYIYFMDSDDLLSLNALEICYDYCQRLRLDFVFFDGDILCEEGQNPLLWDYHRTGRYEEEKVYEGIPLMNDMLDHYTHRAVPWLWLVRRSYLDDIRLRFYPGIIHEDELFSVLLFVQSKSIGCLKRNLVQHRVRSNSTMTKKYSLRNVSCYLTVVDELFVYVRQHSDVLPLIKKYVSYTLNAVFQTAYVLPYADKFRIYGRCLKSGYLSYIQSVVQLKYWLKNE